MKPNVATASVAIAMAVDPSSALSTHRAAFNSGCAPVGSLSGIMDRRPR
nr:hypothetical protein [Sphingomonas panni]